jgi:hypothetical protein
MDALWILSSAVVLSVMAAIIKSRRSPPRNLGFVSRDWILRHGSDRSSA